MRRRKKSWLKRHYVAIMLFLIVIAFSFSMRGYWIYYNELGLTTWDDGKIVFFRPLFSTIKLFGMVFDLTLDEKLLRPNNDGVINQKLVEAYYLVGLARIIAFVPSGAAILSLVKKLLPVAWMRLSYFLWSINPFLRKRLLLIGNNEENIRLYQSDEMQRGAMLFSEPGKDAERLRGIRRCVPESDYRDAPEDGGLEKGMMKELQHTLASEKRDLTVIINTQDDEWNLHLCRAAVACVREAVEEDVAAERKRKKEIHDPKAEREDPELAALRQRVVEKLERVRIFVFGSRQHEQIYYALENASFGTLHYTNKYHLCSFDFVTRYPLTQFLTGEKKSLLEGNGCVAADMDFNMIFIGFGDTNREIFLDSFTTNQFITHRENELPGLKTVHYHIFDQKKAADRDKNLNHSLFRYMDDFEALLKNGKVKAEEYLELPPTPEPPVLHEMSVDSAEFYDEVRRVCLENPKSVNYLVIAFGDDFSNIDLAQRLAEKKEEWGLSDLYIFVKVRNMQNEDVASFLNNGTDKPYIPFGGESFTLDQVLHNEIEEMAYTRKRATLNTVSPEEPLDRGQPLGSATATVLYSWYTMDQITRHSSVYNILSVRMKLQLLGLDYVKREEAENNPLYQNRILRKEEEYFDVYAVGCKPEKTTQPEDYRGARMSYDKKTSMEDYKTYLPRRNLAVQEHFRWNAYMIRSGFIPATIKQIRDGKIKSYVGTRFHANLCSFEALFDYRKMRNDWLSEHEPGKKKEDVIAYDYKLMDEAWFFLNISGYRITRR